MRLEWDSLKVLTPFYFPASFDSASEIRAASFAVVFSAERVFCRCRRSFMHVVVVSGWGPFHPPPPPPTIISFSCFPPQKYFSLNIQ